MKELVGFVGCWVRGGDGGVDGVDARGERGVDVVERVYGIG